MYYILIHKEGDIYNKLLNKLHHHSLAQLMVELLQVKLVTNKPKENFSLDWDNDEKNNDSEDDKAQNGHQEPEMTEDEKKMTAVLNAKKQEIIGLLLRWLSRNNEDFEFALNAYSILMEISENENTYGNLIEGQSIEQLIENACDVQNTH